MSATLVQIHSLVEGTPELFQRFLAARLKAAWDIRNEDPLTPDHTSRMEWAQRVMRTYRGGADAEYRIFLSNPSIQTNGNSSTDGDVQWVVNSLVDVFRLEPVSVQEL